MAKINVKFSSDASNFSRGLKKVQGGIKGIAVNAAKIAAPLVTLGGGIAGIGIAVQSVNKAANFEQLSLQFETLLGSAGAAADRMEDLRKFASATPFGLDEIAKSSKVLETLTKGTLATGDGLKLVGDVAAATGEDFQELSVHVGRLFDGLMSGRAVGESLARLQEIGVLSGTVRGEIETAQKSGKKGAEVWDLARGALGKYSGAMLGLSGTFKGLFSTLRDAWDNLQISFGAPIMDSLKPILKSLTKNLQAMKTMAQNVGQSIGSAFSVMHGAFKQGELWNLAKLGLSSAFTFAINVLLKGLVVAAKSFGQLIKSDLSKLGEGLKNIFANDSMRSSLQFLFKGLGLVMVREINNFMKSNALLKSSANHSFGYDNSIKTQMSMAKYHAGEAGGAVEGGLKTISEELGKGAVKIKDIWDKQADVLDVSGSLQTLKDFSQKFQEIPVRMLDKEGKPLTKQTGGGGMNAAVSRSFGISGLGVSSLARVGGTSGSGSSLTNLQQRANNYLKQLVDNTNNIGDPVLR